VCIKSGSDDKCNYCICGGGSVKYVMSRPSYSDAEWRKLIKIQADIAEQRYATLKAS
jgi:hypothetical protein